MYNRRKQNWNEIDLNHGWISLLQLESSSKDARSLTTLSSSRNMTSIPLKEFRTLLKRNARISGKKKHAKFYVHITQEHKNNPQVFHYSGMRQCLQQTEAHCMARWWSVRSATWRAPGNASCTGEILCPGSSCSAWNKKKTFLVMFWNLSLLDLLLWR